ncbi:unnamed protein product [Closterium sp. NIES-53]
MQEAEQPTELLPQANYAAPTKLNQQQGQRGKPGGGGSGGGWSTKDVDEKRSTRDKGRGGGGRRRECWICHDPDHISYECPNHDDSNEDDIKGGRGQSTSHHPLRDAKPRKEKQTSRKTSLTKDAVAAAVQANPMAVLLDTGCSHHLMGTKAIFVDMAPSDGVNHVRGFNGALQPVEGRGTVALQGEAGKGVLIPDVLYVLGVQANLLSAGQLKESRVQLKGDGDEMLLVATTGGVLSRACYTGQVLCTNLRPCSTRSQSTEVEALRTIIPATKSTSYQLHSRLAHVSVDTIKSSAKHEVATGLDITPSTGADPPCVSCVGGKLARHTFPDKGSDGEEALAVVQIDLCGPFRVATKDGSFYFLLLKDRHTLFVWVMPIAKKSDVLREFQKWLGGDFLGKAFTDFVDGKGIVLDLMCPYIPKQNGMAEREMRTVVESVRTMLLHMGVQHNRWHLALRQPVWVRNCLERSTTPPGTTPYQMLIGKKPDLTLARVWDWMVQFMVLDLTDNKVVTSVEAIFYETLSLEVWSVGADSGTPADRHLDGDGSLARRNRPASTHVSATGDEGSLGALPVATASGIASGQQGAKLVDQYGKPLTTKEQQTEEPVKQEASTGVQSTGELSKSAEDLDIDKEGELSAGEESTDSDVVEVPITKPELRRTAMYDEVKDDLLYDDAEEDEELPELDPNMHADPEHRWDIATMTVKEALASWKGEAVKAAMEKEIRNLIDMGTWELAERPCGVNIMKNRRVLTTKYHIDDTVEHEKARLVVKGFTQLDMKNAFLQSKLNRVLYMYQPDYFDDGTSRVCQLLKSLYGLKQSPLLWYRALDNVLLGAGWKKSQVDEALYLKASDNGVTCWVLVYVDELLAASSSPAMLKELKELLKAAFELRKISQVVKYLGLEIVRNKPARKLWLHQQGYADKLRRRFIDEE